MKKLFLFICFLLFIVSLKAQTILSDFGGYGNIASVTGSGPTFTISVSGFMGNPRFQADGSWNGSDVSIGDVIWTDCARFVITGVTSTSFSTMTVTAEVPAGDWTLGVSVPVVTARCAVVSESFGLPILPPPADGNAGALSGIDGNLYACMQNHYNQSLLTQSNPLNEITDFIGTYDVAPAVPASGETGETWRNSVGELYYSDGTSWYTNKEIRFAITSLEGQSAGRYKIGIDTVGVDTIYISNNGTFRQFLSKVNLDQAYNNFGSTPAIITIDGNEGQGDLVFNLTDTEKFTIQDNDNTKFQVNGNGKVGIGGSANNNGTNSNTVQIAGTIGFGTLTTAASPVTTLDQSFGSIVYLTANSVQSVQLPALTAAENGRVTTFVNKTRFKKTFTQFYMGMDSVLIDTMPPYSVLDIQTISASHKALRLVNYIDDAGNYTNQRNNAINVGGTATETNTYLNMGNISNSRSFTIGKSFYQPFSIDRNKEQYGLSIAPNSSYPISLFKTGNKKTSLYQLFDNQVSSAASVDSVLRNYGYEYNETYFKLDPYNGPSSTNPVFNLISSKFIYGYSGTNMSGIKNPDISASRHLTNVPTFIFSQRGSAYGSKQTSAFSVNSAEYVSSGGGLAGEDASAMLGISTDPSSIDSVSYLMGIYDHVNGDIPAINNFQLSSNRNGRAMVVRQKNQPTLSVNLREYDWLSVDFDNDTLGNEVGFYNRSYRLPNAKPSFTLGVKQQLVWTGTGSDATPAFETVTSGGGSGSIDSVRVVSNNSGIAVKVNTTSSPATEVTLNAIEQGGATTNQVLKWDGSSWVPANIDGIDTISNFTALRAYNGSSKIVFVQNFTYAFNGLSYTTLGGLFRRVTTGSEDGGTLIVATNGVKWARDRKDLLTTYPEWWEVGGYDIDGTTNPSRFTKNGIFNDRDRASAAHRTAGIGGIVEYGSIVKLYLVDKSIPVYSNQKINGNMTRFKRLFSPDVRSTSTIVGTTTFTVTDASQFRIGMTIVGLDTANTRGDATHIDGRSIFETTRDATITAISGNTITVDANFLHPNNQGGTGTIGVGQRIIRTNSIFQWDSGTNNDDPIYASGGEGQHYEGIVIDGNRDNDGCGDFPYAYWLNTYSIEPGNGANFTTYNNCHFRDTPCENILGANATISNSTGRNLGGSFVHYVEGPSGISKKPHPYSVIACTIDSVCMVGNNRSGHSEAAILTSNNTEWGSVSGNTIKNCKEGVFSFAPEEQISNGFNLDAKIRFSNNHAENCRIILANINLSSTTQLFPQVSIIMEHNTFLQCGDFWMDFENLPKGKGAYSIQFNNNTLIGGRLYFRNCDNVQVNGNNIIFNNEYHKNKFNNRIDTRDYWTNYSLDYFQTNASAIALRTCRSVKINGNIIEGFETQNDSLLCGINMAVEWFGIQEPRMKTAAGANTDFYYMQNVEISNNTIANFPYGIAGFARPGRRLDAGNGEGYIALGWKIDNNTIFMQKNPRLSQFHPVDTTQMRTYGIYAQSGTDVTNNRIYKQSSRTTDIPLIYQGLMQVTGFDQMAQKYAGWKISGNEINSGSTSDIAFRVGDPNNNWYQGNILFMNNTMLGTIQSGAGFATTSVNANNMILNNTLLSRYTTPTKVQYNSFMFNKTQY
jgi:hypothetical protein